METNSASIHQVLELVLLYKHSLLTTLHSSCYYSISWKEINFNGVKWLSPFTDILHFRP